MLGRALDATFRNFSTLFLLGAIFFIPLHMVHAFVFRDELAVQELRPEIEEFPPAKKVRNVGAAELARERNTLFVLAGVDMLVAIGLFGAARRVVEIAEASDVPTVGDALRGSASEFRARPDAGVTAGGIVVGAAIAWLVYRIGMLLAESLGASSMFIGVGLARGAAAGALAAVALGCAATSARSARSIPRRAAKIDLY